MTTPGLFSLASTSSERRLAAGFWRRSFVAAVNDEAGCKPVLRAN